jgi:tRNA-2-methylthio-N6-dimethylallyladenosine synthase
VHRPPDSIVDECKRLVAAGVIEITLLGQTVNHYRYSHGLAVDSEGREQPQVGPGLAAFRAPIPDGQRVTTFARLLQRIHDEVPALQRLRFVTSYPRDFGDDILDVMAACPRICRYIHAPAQSGSNRILKAMNRGYTREEYLEFIERVTSKLPDCTIAGDIIVGFPTETDAEFEETVSLVRAVPFKNNFIFKYSPRPGTVAIDRFEDDVPTEVKKLRNNLLLDIQTEVSRRVHESWVGRSVPVLVEEIREHGAAAPADPDSALSLAMAHPESKKIELRWNRRQATPRAGLQAIGRTPGDLIVAINLDHTTVGAEGAQALVGTVVEAQLTAAAPLLLQAQLVQ